MTYVALLRGINVGGNNKVDMKQLKAAFEKLGYTDVLTYINSGNIIFKTGSEDRVKLTTAIEEVIESEFGFHVKVVLRSKADIDMVVDALPDTWTNDADMKCDVMFLWEKYDKPDVVKLVGVKPEIEDLKYIPGALIWRIDRVNTSRGSILKIVGSDLYKHTTIRNCNTARKLAVLMAQ